MVYAGTGRGRRLRRIGLGDGCRLYKELPVAGVPPPQPGHDGVLGRSMHDHGRFAVPDHPAGAALQIGVCSPHSDGIRRDWLDDGSAQDRVALHFNLATNPATGG